MVVDVLIAGAGPTGMMLAIELQRRDISYRLIDIAEGSFQGSRGKGIQPRTLEIFEMLGIADTVLAHSTLYQDMKIHAGPIKVKKAALGTREGPTDERPHPNMVMVSQCQTEIS